VGLAVFAPADTADYQLVVRAFCPADNIPEDPVTGSANAAIAAYLHQCGALAAIGNPYIASQGRELGRDGLVQVRVDDEGEVWIGGKTQTVVSGSLGWE
jgi:PhzF family phenazine biosynthesis protein